MAEQESNWPVVTIEIVLQPKMGQPLSQMLEQISDLINDIPDYNLIKIYVSTK